VRLEARTTPVRNLLDSFTSSESEVRASPSSLLFGPLLDFTLSAGAVDGRAKDITEAGA